jgi:uncharacterized membrane protein
MASVHRLFASVRSAESFGIGYVAFVLLLAVAHKHGGSSALTILITVVVVIIVLVLRGGMLLRLLIRAWAPRGKRHD